MDFFYKKAWLYIKYIDMLFKCESLLYKLNIYINMNITKSPEISD